MPIIISAAVAGRKAISMKGEMPTHSCIRCRVTDTASPRKGAINACTLAGSSIHPAPSMAWAMASGGAKASIDIMPT